MKSSVEESPVKPLRDRGRFSFDYYGCVIVVVSALAMTATLPGRTHGLGLITEPLLDDLGIERTLLGRINLVACLLGTAFCLPVGKLVDRFGVRVALTGVAVALGVSVMGMSVAVGPVSLFLTLVLVRGLGQCALSVVSLATVGKWFRQKLGLAMEAYSILVTFGFIASVLWLGSAVKTFGWRSAWLQLGLMLLLGMAPLSWLLMRSASEQDQTRVDDAVEPTNDKAPDYTLGRTLRTAAFWSFAVGAAAYNFVWSAITFFNESILAERGFNSEDAMQVMAILVGSGLVSNLIGGALARREWIGWLLGVGLGILSVSLALFPSVTTLAQLRVYAAAIGITGGLITVVFFAAWGHVFGRSHLGRIQGAAQVITVVASACGPDLMAELHAVTGSYAPSFYAMALITGGLAAWAVLVRLPAPDVISVAR